MLLFVKFILVGITNTFLGLGIIYIAWSVFGLSDISANLLGYTVGVLWGFLLNSNWTFSSNRAMSQRLGRYVLVCGVAYFGNLVGLFLIRGAIDGRSFVPHVSGAIIYTAVSYLGCKYYVFSKTEKT